MYRTVGVIGAAALGALALLLVVGARAPREVEAATAFVTSTADSGPGSFRQAILNANTNANINLIALTNWLPATITSTVNYTGSQTLTIQGNSFLFNRVIEGNGACARFHSTGGGDVTFQRVTLRDFSCDLALEGAIDIQPPANSGEVILKLDRVVLENVTADNGIRFVETAPSNTAFTLRLTASRIDGCDGQCVSFDESGDGGVDASFTNSVVAGAGGHGVQSSEFDGGATTFTAAGSRFLDNDENGVELVEGGTGNMALSLSGSQFSGNRESAFTASESGDGEASLTGAVLQFAGNAEFGIIVYENGEGNFTANLTAVDASGNTGSGLTLEESGAGDASFTVTGSSSVTNGVGLSVREFGEGRLWLWLSGVTLNGNAGGGLSASEFDDGPFELTILASRMEFNTSAGVLAEEVNEGNFTFLISGSTARENGSGGGFFDGFRLVEREDGGLLGTFSSTSAIDNAADGYVIEEQDDGAFDVTMALSIAAGNGDYGTRASAGGATGTIHALASDVDPYITTNVLVVP
ncbi:MAG: hypothetical protein AB7U23_10430 [Dehalococcoidia bacterium]